MSELADRPLRVNNEPLVLHWWRLLRWFANLRLVPRWREANTRIVLRALRRYYYDGLTRPGKVVFVACLLTFLFSYRSNSDLFLLTAALGFSLLAWSALLGFIYRPRVSVSRRTPVSGIAGQALHSSISVHNHSRRRLFNFTVREQVVPYGRWPKEWDRPHQLQLPTDQATTVPVSFVPLARGRYELTGVVVQSYFPFFLTRFSQHLAAPATIHVLPETLSAAVPSLRQVAEQASKRLTSGNDNSRRGPSLEYSYSRDYQTGDPLRRLDHRAGGRLGRPMSKVFEGAEEIRRDQVYLMLDLTLEDFLPWQRRPVNDKPLDRRLALAVEVGLAARNEGFNLAALATGPTWHTLDKPTDFDRLIAGCAPDRAGEHAANGGATLPDSVLNENGLQVLVLGRWSDAARTRVERWQQAGILTLVFMLPESAAHAGTLPAGSQFVEIQPALSGRERA